MTPSGGTAARTLLLGTESPFATAVFEALVAAGVELVGVGVDGLYDPRAILALSSRDHRTTLASRAAERELAVRAVVDVTHPDVAAWVADLAPDFILVACFGRVLPESLCALAARDCLNLHPSLLPRYRGPVPLFWQLRDGTAETGITLHRVAPEIDAGPVVARARLALEPGADGDTHDARLAQAGVALFVDAVADDGPLAAEAQDESAATRQPLPRAGDFRVSTTWSARRVYAFMRGTAHWGMPYPVEVDGRERLLAGALAWSENTSPEAMATGEGDTVRLRCTPGVVEARLAREPGC